MPTFNLSCQITVSAYTTVEASTLEEAIAEAGSRSAELHFIGSGTDPSEVWCVEEADGMPEGITES